MKIVAITLRVDTIENYHENRDAIDQRWYHFLAHCDLIPLLLPNNTNISKCILKQYTISGYVLSGGNQSLHRNDLEHEIISECLANNIPLIGVCHGMQQIQRFFGLSLVKVPGHVCTSQSICINGKRQIVNSYHDYGTTETHPDLHVWAHANDGVIKAIKHNKAPMTGIMWHPERNQPFNLQDITLFKKTFYGTDK